MTKFDVLTIGNAIVDISAATDDDFLIAHDIIKGAMNLISAERAKELYQLMGPAVEMSGGSAANTAAGIANLGGKTAFMGKVGNDQLGRVFNHDLNAQGVFFDTPPASDSLATAQCIIFHTPDGERSMNTFLGACLEFGPEDIDVAKIAESQLIYFEGYLWDPPRAKDALRLAANIAHKHHRKVALTLSDSFCVDRYREEFLQLIRSGAIDIVFSNEAEIHSLYQTSSLDQAIIALREDCRELACVTCAERGSLVVTRDETFSVRAIPVDNVVDTTGAGDLYAAGFLYGYTHGMDLNDSARLGSLAGGYVVQQVGPRLQFSLRDKAVEAGLMAL